TFTAVPFQTVVDPGTNWSVDTYTAPLAQRYAVSATLVVKSGGVVGSFYALIYVNGVEWSRVQGYIPATTVPTAIHIQDVVVAAAAQTIKVYCWTPNSGNSLSGTGSDVCFASIVPIAS